MDDTEARERFGAARVARLATVGAAGRPHLVPVVFALVGEDLWSAVDDKPKTTRALKRLANIAAHPAVSVLVDHYDDDWSRLWWVRADGVATVVEVGAPGTERAMDALAAKYPQYAVRRPPGPLVRVIVSRWSAWEAGPTARPPGHHGVDG